jgi:hypothetical protein
MGKGIGFLARKFFLPFGSLESLESEIYFLVNNMRQGYTDVMRMPYSRRKRFVDLKLTELKTKEHMPAPSVPRRRR